MQWFPLRLTPGPPNWCHRSFRPQQRVRCSLDQPAPVAAVAAARHLPPPKAGNRAGCGVYRRGHPIARLHGRVGAFLPSICQRLNEFFAFMGWLFAQPVLFCSSIKSPQHWSTRPSLLRGRQRATDLDRFGNFEQICAKRWNACCSARSNEESSCRLQSN